MAETNAIRDYIFKQREEARNVFDEQHRSLIDEAVAEIGRPYSFLVTAVIEGADLRPGPRFDGFALVKSALESLVSSLQLSRDGAQLDALALLRVAVEACCVAVHIIESPEAYERYAGRRSRPYDSNRAISFSKKRIHRVEKFWSILSNAAIHPSRRFYGPQPLDDGSLSVRFGPIVLNSRDCELLMLILSIAALIVQRACEVVLLVDDNQRDGWLRLVGTNFIATAHGNTFLKRKFDELDAFTATGLA